MNARKKIAIVFYTIGMTIGMIGIFTAPFFPTPPEAGIFDLTRGKIIIGGSLLMMLGIFIGRKKNKVQP